MTEPTTRTVGIKSDIHRELKLLCADRGWTMTEAIAHMMKVLKETEKDGKHDNPTAEPDR